MGEPSWPGERERVSQTPYHVYFFRRPCSAVSVELGAAKSCQPIADNYFRKKHKFRIATAEADLLKRCDREKERASSRGRSAIPGRGGRRYHNWRAGLGRNYWLRPAIRGLRCRT